MVDLTNEGVRRERGVEVPRIEPLGDRVLVQPIPEEQEGAIYIPEVAADKPQQGEVLAVGAEVHQVGVGQRVLFAPFAGIEIKRPGRYLPDGTPTPPEEWLILRAVDILAVLW